jgi:CHASE3 domain sensor protein
MMASSWRRFAVVHPLAVALVLAAVIALVLVGFAWRSSAESIEALEAVARAQRVIQVLDELVTDVQTIETAQRGFQITGNREYLAPVDGLRREVDAHFERLESLDSAELVESLRGVVGTKLAFVDEVIAVREREGFDAAREISLTGRGTALMDEVHIAVGSMKRRELAALREREAALRRQSRNRAFLLGPLAVIDALLLVAVVALMIREKRRNRQLAATLAERATRRSASPLSARPSSPT